MKFISCYRKLKNGSEYLLDGICQKATSGNLRLLQGSLKVADKLITGIIQKTINLEANPEIGTVEEFLHKRKEEFRFLVYKNYKIIYWINQSENRIEIADIFDTRQHPIRLKRNK